MTWTRQQRHKRKQHAKRLDDIERRIEQLEHPLVAVIPQGAGTITYPVKRVLR